MRRPGFYKEGNAVCIAGCSRQRKEAIKRLKRLHSTSLGRLGSVRILPTNRGDSHEIPRSTNTDSGSPPRTESRPVLKSRIALGPANQGEIGAPPKRRGLSRPPRPRGHSGSRFLSPCPSSENRPPETPAPPGKTFGAAG